MHYPGKGKESHLGMEMPIGVDDFPSQSEVFRLFESDAAVAQACKTF
jgi:hypothetical protein